MQLNKTCLGMTGDTWISAEQRAIVSAFAEPASRADDVATEDAGPLSQHRRDDDVYKSAVRTTYPRTRDGVPLGSVSV